MRVLIATVTAGAGHLQAAAAVNEAWRQLRPADVVEKVDVLDYVPKLQRKIYVEGYVKLVSHAPDIWGMVFKKTDNTAWVTKASKTRRVFARGTNPRFVKFVREFKPDIVIATHYLPAEIMGHLKASKKGPRTFTASVVTDFEAHALWMEAGVDLYCVAAEETKASLAARGVTADKLVVTGIPIAAKFKNIPAAAVLRKSFSLRDDQPVLLVLGGGFGMGPVGKILTALDKVPGDFQVLVVAGRNEELRRELACRDYRHPTRIFGFVSNMHELMSVADLIVTKPGGLTSSEALAIGRPMFILDPIPGQEAANSDFLLERGVATKVNRAEDVAFRVEQLLGSRRLKEMAQAALAMGKPDAATDVCRAVVGRFEKASL